MRALTIWQPWASLIVGAPASYDEHDTPPQKPIENRGWRPPPALIGQRIAIHAAKKLDEDTLDTIHDLFRDKLYGEVRTPYAKPSLFPRGAVIGVGTLDRVIELQYSRDEVPPSTDRRFETIPQSTIDSWGLGADGLRFFFGPVGWVFRDRRHLRDPVPCSGAQGVWTLPADVAARVEEQLR